MRGSLSPAILKDEGMPEPAHKTLEKIGHKHFLLFKMRRDYNIVIPENDMYYPLDIHGGMFISETIFHYLVDNLSLGISVYSESGTKLITVSFDDDWRTSLKSFDHDLIHLAVR